MPSRTEIAAFRFGYGLPAIGPVEPEPLVACLAGPDPAAALWPAHGTAEVLQNLKQIREARAAGQAAAGDATAMAQADAALAAAHDGNRALYTQAARASFARAVGSATPFRERMVAFWADHFTTTSRNQTQLAWASALVEEAIRPYLSGRFATLLQAVTLHPAMLIYLDQSASVGPTSRRGAKRGEGLNENLARELLELHTLGVDAGYTQQDVRETAQLLTGLTVVPERGGFVFDPSRVEPGADTILGTAYDGRGTAPILQALQDLSVRPETARHLARKLAVHFVSDDPEPALVAALEAEWLRSGGDLSAVTLVLTSHRAARAAEPGKARQPFDFLVAAMRALGVPADQIHGMETKPFGGQLMGRLKRMGQDWQRAPGPDGWPEAAAAWITPHGMAARIDWALAVPQRMLAELPDPREFAIQALGSRADAALRLAVSRSESRREAIALVLASPAFNRR
ncbi:DUF1800 domain-containing protein [Xinfangfangia pollutisoli]|uniref:DUF1800 domain-containing protein n=1 Tax=Xinfangfangia pollutisoli TaxID=2865960 RepID=UPI001CD1C376|nr:DUF1800 domain-containing protein [Xinfangfangia pollutisoli]